MDLGDIVLSGKSFALPAQGFSKEGRKERCNELTFRKWLFRLLNNYNILPKILQKMAEMVIYYIVKLWIWRMDPCNLVVQVQLAQ